MGDFERLLQDTIREAIELHRNRLMPALAQSYGCRASCFESSPDLDSAEKCSERCDNGMHDLSENIRSWSEGYSRFLSTCSAECLEGNQACLQSCLQRKKTQGKYLADLRFLFDAHFKLRRV